MTEDRVRLGVCEPINLYNHNHFAQILHTISSSLPKHGRLHQVQKKNVVFMPRLAPRIANRSATKKFPLLQRLD